MIPAVATAYKQIDIWLENHPNAKTASPYIQRAIDRVERHHLTTFDRNTHNVDVDDLEAALSAYSKRREVEHALADYMHWVANELLRDDVHAQANRCSCCRMTGSYGSKPDGGLMVAWDYKCGSVRLCPDESREEQKRLTNFYQPPMLKLAKHPLYRIYYSVLTAHNYRAGDLKRGKRELFEKFNQLLKKFPNIKGALVIQEDPLSAHDDWNVHLNVFFVVKGEFSYKQLRKAWGSNLHLQQIKGDAGALRSALLEAIKYSAQIVPVKSLEKAKAHENTQHPDHDRSRDSYKDHGSARLLDDNFLNDTDRLAACDHNRTSQQLSKTDNSQPPPTPAMTEWPARRWIEWYDAQAKFRRTRAYGCLYALHGKLWNAMTVAQRIDTCFAANVTSWFARFEWKSIGPTLTKKQRQALKTKLRVAMVSGEAMDLNQVKWRGTISFSRGVGYSVDLIPGHNFPCDPGKTDNSARVHDPGGAIH